MNNLKRVKSTDLQVLRSILNDEIVIDDNENVIPIDYDGANNKVLESKSCDSEMENKITVKDRKLCKKKMIKTHDKPFMITRIETKHKSDKVTCENASMYSDNAKSSSVQPVYKSVHYSNIVNTEKRLNKKYEDLAKLLNEEILVKTASLCDQSINEARQLIQNSLATSRIVSSFLVDLSESGRKIPTVNMDRVFRNSDQDQRINKSVDRITQNSDRDQRINKSVDRITQNSDQDQRINKSVDRITQNSDQDQRINKSVDRITQNSDRDQQINWHVDGKIGNVVTGSNRLDHGESERIFNIDSTVAIHNSQLDESLEDLLLPSSTTISGSGAPRRAATDHVLTSDEPFIRGWLTHKNRQQELERRLKKEQLRIERAISMSAVAVQQQRKVAAEESFRNWIKEKEREGHGGKKGLLSSVTSNVRVPLPKIRSKVKQRQGPTTTKEKEDPSDNESDISPAQAGRQPKPTQMCMKRSRQMLRPKSCAAFCINKEAKIKVSGQQMSILSSNFAPESCRCSTKIDYSKYVSKRDATFIRPETAVPQHRKKNFPLITKSAESPFTSQQKAMKKLKKKRKKLPPQTELNNNFPARNTTKPASIYSDEFSDSEKEAVKMDAGNDLGKEESIAIKNTENEACDSVITVNGVKKVADEISDHFSSFGYDSHSSL